MGDDDARRVMVLASLSAPSGAKRLAPPPIGVDFGDVLRLRAVTGCDERTIRGYLEALHRGEEPNVKPVTARRIRAGAESLGMVLPIVRGR